MKADDVLVARDADALWVTVNRPDQRNPLSRAVLAGIRGAFASARDDGDLRFAVVTGAGARCFAAGGDLDELDAPCGATPRRWPSRTRPMRRSTPCAASRCRWRRR